MCIQHTHQNKYEIDIRIVIREKLVSMDEFVRQSILKAESTAAETAEKISQITEAFSKLGYKTPDEIEKNPPSDDELDASGVAIGIRAKISRWRDKEEETREKIRYGQSYHAIKRAERAEEELEAFRKDVPRTGTESSAVLNRLLKEGQVEEHSSYTFDTVNAVAILFLLSSIGVRACPVHITREKTQLTLPKDRLSPAVMQILKDYA